MGMDGVHVGWNSEAVESMGRYCIDCLVLDDVGIAVLYTTMVF